MNKTQRIIIWIVAVALSGVSIWWAVLLDIQGWHFEQVIFLMVVPILLLGAAAFIGAGGKGREGKK